MMPKYSWWWITAQHRETRKEKTHLVKFRGPFPLKDELEYYCPPDVCVVTEMRWSRNSDKWIDDSVESQNSAQQEMKKQLLKEKNDK